MSQPAYVGIEALATYLGVSSSTIRQWVKTRKIPRASYIKIGITYRFHWRAVEDALLNYKNKAGLTDEEREEMADKLIKSLEVDIDASKPANVSPTALAEGEAKLAASVRGVPHLKDDATLDEELSDMLDTDNDTNDL